MIPNIISFAGAGRVAGALCRKLYKSNYKIGLIVSETKENGEFLANSCDTAWSQDLYYPDSTNLIIVSVPDHKLKSVLDKLVCQPDTLVVHTAGSIGLDIFPENIKNRGVFYPLQTFSKDHEITFQDVPIFIEASDSDSSDTLKKIAESIGGKVYCVDTKNRIMLQLAAVFVCNFTNHMLTTGKEVALKAGFTFDVLVPLLTETISKAIILGPENSQTGPAVRHDNNTIEKHLELLSYSPELQKIYNEMSQSIIKYYQKS